MNTNQLKTLFADDPEIMSLLNDRGKDRLQALIDILRKGEKGDTPQKGVDYFTSEDIAIIRHQILELSTPIKGRDYYDGVKGDQGDKGDKGDRGIPGEDGNDGSPGKDGNDGSDGSPDSPKEIANKLNTLEGAVDMTVIKGLEKLVDKNSVDNRFSNLSNRVNKIDQRWHGSGLTSNGKIVTAIYVIDGGGSTITTGVKGYLEIPFDMTITGWVLLADQTGSIVVDVWKSSYASFPPLVANTIAGSELPTLVSVQKNEDLLLSTWTTALIAGDILAFNVNSVTTVQRITLSIIGTKV